MGFLNTVLFTFHVFDIFQNKKAKNIYQQNVQSKTLYHEYVSLKKLFLHPEDIYKNAWRCPVSALHVENLKWSSLFSLAPLAPPPAGLPSNGPSEWIGYGFSATTSPQINSPLISQIFISNKHWGRWRNPSYCLHWRKQLIWQISLYSHCSLKMVFYKLMRKRKFTFFTSWLFQSHIQLLYFSGIQRDINF